MERQMQDWYEEGQEQEAKELCPGGNSHWRDYVEVVKCKDCVHATESIYRQELLCERVEGMRMFDDDYCSYGVRRM